MTPKTGNYSPDELAARLSGLQEKVKNIRRGDLVTLLAEIESLTECISAELHLDENVLAEAKTRYRKEFSFLDRVNPFNKERQQSHQKSVAPVSDEVMHDRRLLTRCCELLEWVRNASQPIEWRTNWHGGIAGAYNEFTGNVEWRETWHTGIAGVYHPDLRQVEWREQWKHGVAGVFNSASSDIEWRDNWHGGVFGVFNPKSQEVEWRESWHRGVCGIYNPLTETVDWKESWKGGIAGAWCPQTKTVLWHEAWHHGVACIYFDGSSYRSSGSYYGDED
jgi:intein/homing endonuclease